MPIAIKNGAILLKPAGLGFVATGGDPCSCCFDCGPQSFASGGAGHYERVHRVQAASGSMTLDWNAFTVPDRFRVFINGTAIYDTGNASGSGSFTFCKPANAEVKIVVDGPQGTGWQYSLSCPTGSC